jgi:phosphate transporter
VSLTRLDRGGSPSATDDPLLPGIEQYELVDYKHIQKRQQLETEGARRAAKRAGKARRLDEQDDMKFSHSIQFNAVPDWSSQYIAYSNLKKLSVYALSFRLPQASCIVHSSPLTASRIYQLEKNIHRPSTSGQDAESSLLIGDNVDPDQVFTRALDVELEKISSFYQLKELEIYGEVGEFLKDEEAYKAESHDAQEGIENRPSSTSRRRQSSILRSFISNKRSSTISQSIDGGMEDSDDDDDETTALNATKRPKSRSKSTAFDGDHQTHGEDMRSSTEFSKSMRRNSQAYDDYAEQAFATIYSSGITLKKRAISLYVQLCELKSFIQLNKTGFAKVLKKYDKILDRNLKSKYIDNHVSPAYPFRAETIKHIEENIAKMEEAYADIVTHGDVALAKQELRLHLREHVVWERNTVWREMIGIERKSQAANMGIRRTLLGIDTDPAKARKTGDDDQLADVKELRTPVGRFFCPTWLLSSTMYTLIGIVVIFIILLYVPIMDKPEQQNCLAMLVFVSLLWATEV